MRKRAELIARLLGGNFDICQGCNQKKLLKNLSIWEGLLGDILVCYKCRNHAYIHSDWHEAVALNIYFEDLGEEL